MINAYIGVNEGSGVGKGFSFPKINLHSKQIGQALSKAVHNPGAMLKAAINPVVKTVQNPGAAIKAATKGIQILTTQAYRAANPLINKKTGIVSMANLPGVGSLQVQSIGDIPGLKQGMQFAQQHGIIKDFNLNDSPQWREYGQPAIAILGTAAAGIATVVSGGTLSPLLGAAIAGTTTALNAANQSAKTQTVTRQAVHDANVQIQQTQDAAAAIEAQTAQIQAQAAAAQNNINLQPGISTMTKGNSGTTKGNSGTANKITKKQLETAGIIAGGALLLILILR